MRGKLVYLLVSLNVNSPGPNSTGRVTLPYYNVYRNAYVKSPEEASQFGSPAEAIRAFGRAVGQFIKAGDYTKAQSRLECMCRPEPYRLVTVERLEPVND